MSKLKLDPGAHQIFLMLYTTALLGWQKVPGTLSHREGAWGRREDVEQSS